ncbi:DUF2127 domain-containing protein [Arthrobacter sp. TMP15]|uniref:DUF2127 domain-containing protein n=1 Tax=Arthrobacter sp. TMP15 TaxID=3140789 RepID=UPI0031BA8F15
MRMLRMTDWWDKFFAIGIILKGLDGVLELLGGSLLLFAAPATIHDIAVLITQPELSEDPNDFLSNHILRGALGLSDHVVLFTALYLLAHGLVKVVLVLALLMNKLWAYPWMIAVLVVFILYQLYQLTLTPSAGLVALTVFDILIVVLTGHEYGRHRRRKLEGQT